MSNTVHSAWKSAWEFASNHSTSSSWCMDNGGWAHLFKRVKLLSVSQVCLFLIWKRRLTHFSLSNFWSSSQVLQHHQKWFMICTIWSFFCILLIFVRVSSLCFCLHARHQTGEWCLDVLFQEMSVFVGGNP